MWRRSEGVVVYSVNTLLRIFQRMCRWKKIENRSIFGEDIDKNLRLTFGPHSIIYLIMLLYECYTYTLYIERCIQQQYGKLVMVQNIVGTNRPTQSTCMYSCSANTLLRACYVMLVEVGQGNIMSLYLCVWWSYCMWQKDFKIYDTFSRPQFSRHSKPVGFSCQNAVKKFWRCRFCRWSISRYLRPINGSESISACCYINKRISYIISWSIKTLSMILSIP